MPPDQSESNSSHKLPIKLQHQLNLRKTEALRTNFNMTDYYKLLSSDFK